MPSAIEKKFAPFHDLTVLIADDDAIIRESLARTLNLYFHTTLTANSAEQALALFERTPVHVAILDIAMPGGISGLDAAARMRERDPDLPVIILTCHSDTSFLQTAVRLRLMDYLIKPVGLSQLEDALLRCLDHLRQKNRLETVLRGGAVYNAATGIVRRAGRDFQLTRNEKRFLNFMLVRRGIMVDPIAICAAFEDERDFSVHALRNLVYRLRSKTGHDAVVCNKDIGYMLP